MNFYVLGSFAISAFRRIPSSTYFVGYGDYTSQALQKSCFHTSNTVLAARKGTRERKKLKKIKKEVQKVGFVPGNKKNKRNTRTLQDLHWESKRLEPSPDNVYCSRHHMVRWSAREAINLFQEAHHPTMCNQPESYINVQIELNMQGEKKTRLLDAFTRNCLIPHAFSYGKPRQILAVCKESEMQKLCIDAGAATVGGTELIKSIQNGDVNPSSYDFILAHPNILTDLVPIRGLLRKKFPNIAMGTLDLNLPVIVKRFCAGIQFRSEIDEIQPNYARIDTPIGMVKMETNQLVENFQQVLVDIDKNRPKRAGLFVTRCYFTSPPSKLNLRVDPFEFIPSGELSEKAEEEPEEVEVKPDVDSDDESEDKSKVTAKV